MSATMASPVPRRVVGLTVGDRGSLLDMRGPSFVPDDFEPPAGLVTPDFVLEPLGPQHNERDYAAWTSSIEHILATPGIVQPGEKHSWPHPMAPEENLSALVHHAEDFAVRRGFTYTVLDPVGNDVIGCLYIYPSKDDEHDARVKSWVKASRAELDLVLWRAVADWLAAAWPFRNPQYAARA
jgi:hypothetical protein